MTLVEEAQQIKNLQKQLAETKLNGDQQDNNKFTCSECQFNARTKYVIGEHMKDQHWTCYLYCEKSIMWSKWLETTK